MRLCGTATTYLERRAGCRQFQCPANAFWGAGNLSGRGGNCPIAEIHRRTTAALSVPISSHTAQNRNAGAQYHIDETLS